MTKKVLIILILITGIKGYCSTIDTTIFDSELEKSTFLKLAGSSNIDTVDLFISLGYDNNEANIKSEINSYVRKLKASANTTNTKRLLKTIYQSVHSNFFRKYTEDTYFDNIFSTGEYNCVTASALYALILNRFGIKYNIKETPSHVYLIADPQQTSYKIETTLPSGGLIRYDDKFKKSFIDYLHENKIISDEEYNDGTINNLFTRYYETDKSINLKELAGVQYYNKAISQLNDKKYMEASKNIEKAEFLYSSDFISYLKNIIYANILNNEILEKNYNGKYLANYINSNPKNFTAIQYGKDYFNNISNEMVINHPDIENYTRYFTNLITYLNDSIQQEDFQQAYYTFMGYHHYCKYNYQSALKDLEKSYRINPDNMRTKQLISEASIKYLIVDNKYESRIDSVEVYFQKYDFLKHDKSLQQFLIYCYAKVISTYFQNNNLFLGDRYLNRLELFIKDNPDIELSEEYIGSVYSEAAAYYVRKQKYNTAMNILKKGLNLIPNSGMLKSRLETIGNSKGSLYAYKKSNASKSDNSKYYSTLSYVKANNEKINNNIEKYIYGKWTTYKIIKNGVQVNFPVEEGFTMYFMKAKKIKYVSEGEVLIGNWDYDKTTCTLILTTDDDDLGNIYIMVTEINSSMIKGLMFFGGDTEDSNEILFKSVKD